MKIKKQVKKPVKRIKNYTTKAKFEIIRSETGVKYKVLKSFTVRTKYGDVTVPKGFEHDRYTVVPDLPDDTPAIVHDYLYEQKKFDNGNRCKKYQADLVFYCLMYKSPECRPYAKMYYLGVVIFGIIPWLQT